MQTHPKGRRGKWIAPMLEYDLEIKPTKLIKGQGLAKLMAESNLHALEINLIVAFSEEEAKDSQPRITLQNGLKQSQLGKILSVIIQFIESNTLSRFRCPQKIITDNAYAFKSRKIVEFCGKYHIALGHSTTYHPQGNGLIESSNKFLNNIIKKFLEVNKKNSHQKLINALWADRVSNKKSTCMSPFQLVYGIDIIFPSPLVVPVMKILQELDNETNDMHEE
eukprot:PITA_15067